MLTRELEVKVEEDWKPVVAVVEVQSVGYREDIAEVVLGELDELAESIVHIGGRGPLLRSRARRFMKLQECKFQLIWCVANLGVRGLRGLPNELPGEGVSKSNRVGRRGALLTEHVLLQSACNISAAGLGGELEAFLQ